MSLVLLTWLHNSNTTRLLVPNECHSYRGYLNNRYYIDCISSRKSTLSPHFPIFFVITVRLFHSSLKPIKSIMAEEKLVIENPCWNAKNYDPLFELAFVNIVIKNACTSYYQHVNAFDFTKCIKVIERPPSSNAFSRTR